jgi:hypothetical protein
MSSRSALPAQIQGTDGPHAGGMAHGTVSEIKNSLFLLVVCIIMFNFAADMVMCLVFHRRMKRESGANPEQYPLL